jgi:hypothetical protein
VRLARWARIAPPFGIGPQRDGTLEEAPLLDSLVLMDTHNFSLCDDVSQKLALVQSAIAILPMAVAALCANVSLTHHTLYKHRLA